MLRVVLSVILMGLLMGCNESSEVSVVVDDTHGASLLQKNTPKPELKEVSASKKLQAVQATKKEISPVNASGELYVEGKHYKALARPIPTSDPSKVEITEFFWYGCSHCYNFEPSLKKYKATLPDAIQVVAVPAMWRSVMNVHAKAFYAVEALNMPELHEAIFKAMNIDRNPLSNEAQVAALFAKHGVEKDKAMKLLGSFGVSAQVNKARSLAAGAKISGTPSLVVNGKYLVEARLAGNQVNMLKIADYLAKKEVKH